MHRSSRDRGRFVIRAGTMLAALAAVAARPAGASTIVTLVKVKKDLIEFQLGGGGFGTFADAWNSGVSLPSFLDKSSREKEVERRLQDESDPHRRRELERELDELREDRERQNRRIAERRAELEERGREQIAAKRLTDGSRFNLRYAGPVPRDVTPQDVMAALAPYVDFSGAAPAIGEPTPAGAPMEPPAEALPRKGMTRDEAQREFGAPLDSSERREGDLIVRTLVFLRGDRRIAAEFLNDTLIRYTVGSR